MNTIKTLNKKIWLLIASSLFLSTTLIYASNEYIPNEILVKFKAETKKEDAKSSNSLRWKLNAIEVKKFVINNGYTFLWI